MENQKPIYNIKAVSTITGILPVTLRAWERRHGIPVPERGGQGYRLYSEKDIRTLLWLKRQVDSGVSISIAVENLNLMLEKGNDPTIKSHFPEIVSLPKPKSMAADMLDAIYRMDEERAGTILRQAFTLFPLENVLEEIIQPNMVEIGDAWHRGDLPIAVEHFATQFYISQLMNMISSAGSPYQDGTIIAACAPGETHQLGILMVVVLLKWRGWDVCYLGPDLHLDRFAETLIPVRPKVILFTATLEKHAENLKHLYAQLENVPDPKPHIVFGGRAFIKARLPGQYPALYLQGSLEDIVNRLEQLAQL